uniref:Uncharacterized protein n=1 Tax=Anguilla anguilla TaxID=7936 RepID=A0A0E9VI92_ANGAN
MGTFSWQHITDGLSRHMFAPLIYCMLVGKIKFSQ